MRLRAFGKRRRNSRSSTYNTTSSPNGIYSVKKSWKLSDLSEKNTPPANDSPVSKVSVITKFRNRCVFFPLVGGGTEFSELGAGGVGGVGVVGAAGEALAACARGGEVWVFGLKLGGISGTWMGDVGVILLGVGGAAAVPADIMTVSAGPITVPAGAKGFLEPGRFPGVLTSLDSAGKPGWGILTPAKNRCIFDMERGGQPGVQFFFSLSLPLLSMAYIYIYSSRTM